MPLLIGLLCFSLLAVFCFRNFFIQLVSMKLLLDVLVSVAFSIRGSNQESYSVQVAAMLISSLGILVFFILMASGIQLFSSSNSLDLEVDNE
jgi:hypothetical protein